MGWGGMVVRGEGRGERGEGRGERGEGRGERGCGRWGIGGGEGMWGCDETGFKDVMRLND